MTTRSLVQRVKSVTGQRSPLTGILVLALVCLVGFAPLASAKEASLTAIELYDGPSGAAYVQLADVLINGKAEMRDCSSFQAGAVDKSSYGKMGKVMLGAGGVLERGDDGVMRYSAGPGRSVCVAPANARFERGGSYSLSDLAHQAVLHGNPIGGARSSGGSAVQLGR